MTQLYKDHADRSKQIKKLLLEQANALAAMRAVQQINGAGTGHSIDHLPRWT